MASKHSMRSLSIKPPETSIHDFSRPSQDPLKQHTKLSQRAEQQHGFESDNSGEYQPLIASNLPERQRRLPKASQTAGIMPSLFDRHRSPDSLTYEPPLVEPDDILLSDIKLQLLDQHKALDELTIVVGALGVAICALVELLILNAVNDKGPDLWLQAVFFLVQELSYAILLMFLKLAKKRAWNKFAMAQKVGMSFSTVLLASVLGTGSTVAMYRHSHG